MKKDKKRDLAKVAYMYYIEGLTQNEISKKLGIYRTTVSRFLIQARDEGIVEIKVNDYDVEIFRLESELKDRFNLKDVEIAPVEENDLVSDKEEKVALTASIWLRKKVTDGSTVGLSWGESVGNAIHKIENKYLENTTFVPIVGGPSHINSRYHVNTLVYEIARKFHGESLFINSTVVQESKQLTEGIFNSQYFNEIKNLWNKLDLVIVGIGGPLSYKKSQWRDLLNEVDLEDLGLREAIGDCCCRFYDRDGKILKGDLYQRTIGLSLEELSRVPSSLGIARGKIKARSIHTAVKNGYINSLITDQETALEIIRIDKQITGK